MFYNLVLILGFKSKGGHLVEATDSHVQTLCLDPKETNVHHVFVNRATCKVG